MKLKKERPAVPYTYLIDNFKVLLIFLVVFNHIIAFNAPENAVSRKQGLPAKDILFHHARYCITRPHVGRL